MKRIIMICLASAALAYGATTINSDNSYAYSANTGWLTLRPDSEHGAVIGRWYCSGYLWSPSIGWISLGSGAPENGWRYANNSESDWGVNHDGKGGLTGYAYSANTGWVTFEDIFCSVTIDLETGQLGGSAWSANIGWISLSNEVAFVATDGLASGPDLDRDGIPDIWEYKMAGDLTTLDRYKDSDGDGLSDRDEYQAGTDPLDPDSRFEIVGLEHGVESDLVTIKVVPGRVYSVYNHDSLPPKAPKLPTQRLLPDADNPTLQIAIPHDGAERRFYRAGVSLPLP